MRAVFKAEPIVGRFCSPIGAAVIAVEVPPFGNEVGHVGLLPQRFRTRRAHIVFRGLLFFGSVGCNEDAAFIGAPTPKLALLHRHPLMPLSVAFWVGATVETFFHCYVRIERHLIASVGNGSIVAVPPTPRLYRGGSACIEYLFYNLNDREGLRLGEADAGVELGDFGADMAFEGRFLQLHISRF